MHNISFSMLLLHHNLAGALLFFSRDNKYVFQIHMLQAFLECFDGSDTDLGIGTTKQRANESAVDCLMRFMEATNGHIMPDFWLVAQTIEPHPANSQDSRPP